MKKNFIEQVILYDYRYIIGYLSIIVIALYGLFWRLGSLLPGLGQYEAEYLATFDQSLGSIADNPLYWPHKFLTQLTTGWLGSSEFAYRLPSALFAMVGLWMFFLLIRHRFKARVAMVGVLLLATSSWWLGAVRLARPEILLPVAMFLLVWLARLTLENHGRWWLILLGLTLGVSLYLPLMPYVIAIASTVGYSLIRKTAKSIELGWKLGFWGVIAAAAIPLAWAAFNDPSLIKTLLGWPGQWPELNQYVGDIQGTLSSIFWSASEFLPLNLGDLPYLDIFTVAMVILGFYYLDHEISRSLTQFLAFGFLGLILIMNVGPQPGDRIVLIPFIYTLAAAGIVMLFSQWYEIFPKNPIARMVAFLPTIILLLTVVWYHHTRLFVARPNSTQITQAFPPLSSALYDYLAAQTSADKVVILTTDEERLIAEASARTFAHTQVTTVSSAAIGQPKIVISHAALNRLDSASAELLGNANLVAVHSAFDSQPVVLWYTSHD